jgi:uncharacterized repeat protein (TIGR03809 family)
MAQRYDAEHAREHAQAHAQDVLNRWCVLAEQRLDHLIELYESGRWRRYHSENAFMENLREAKIVVETWRVLARREATPDNRAIDWSWLDQPAEVPPAIQDEPEQSSARLLGTAAVHAALASIVALQEDAAVEADDARPARKRHQAPNSRPGSCPICAPFRSVIRCCSITCCSGS